ncbi:MAG: GNAT family protein [Olleya sp.]
MSILEYDKTIILENDYVKLSPLKEKHSNDLLEISNESSIWKYLLEKGNGLKNLTNYIQTAIKNRELKREYPFIVFDKINNKYAGTTRFYDYSEQLKSIKLGHTWYGELFRGTGLNKHCKYLLLEYTFEKLKLERIGFGVHQENKVSLAALKSIGCKEEGKLRNFIASVDNKGRTAIVLLNIVKDEWHNIKLQLIQQLNRKT